MIYDYAFVKKPKRIRDSNSIGLYTRFARLIWKNGSNVDQSSDTAIFRIPPCVGAPETVLALDGGGEELDDVEGAVPHAVNAKSIASSRQASLYLFFIMNQSSSFKIFQNGT